MPAEIGIGFSCRDVNLLPDTEGELQDLFNNHIGPTLYNEFMTQFENMRSIGLPVTRTYNPLTEEELKTRDCSVSGNISIKF